MNSFKRKALSFLLIFSLFVGIVGIVNVETTYAASKKIHLKKTSISLVSGNTYQQKLIDKNGRTIKTTKVKWKSSKTSVAKINKKGKITAAKAGTAKMTAKYKGKTYKFTVKVKKPFKDGEKPIIDTIYDTQYSQDDSASVTFYTKDYKLAEYKSGVKFECYYSVNNGEFVYFDTTPDGFFYFENAAENNTYSFKIRWVYGEYYSDFSDEASITIKPNHNTSISVEPSSITLKIGETKTVIVKSDAGKVMSAQKSNNNISVSWGDWLPDNKSAYLNVKALSAGNTVLNIYDKKDSSVSATLNVTITSD